MPFDYGLRLDNRQRIANARAKPIKANKNQSVDGAEGLSLGSGSPQNVYLLPQRQNFRLDSYPRPKQIQDRPNNEPERALIPQQHRPILDQLLVRLSLRQGQVLATLLITTGFGRRTQLQIGIIPNAGARYCLRAWPR
jgi:hypothetical protein